MGQSRYTAFLEDKSALPAAEKLQRSLQAWPKTFGLTIIIEEVKTDQPFKAEGVA